MSQHVTQLPNSIKHTFGFIYAQHDFIITYVIGPTDLFHFPPNNNNNNNSATTFVGVLRFQVKLKKTAFYSIFLWYMNLLLLLLLLLRDATELYEIQISRMLIYRLNTDRSESGFVVSSL